MFKPVFCSQCGDALVAIGEPYFDAIGCAKCYKHWVSMGDGHWMLLGDTTQVSASRVKICCRHCQTKATLSRNEYQNARCTSCGEKWCKTTVELEFKIECKTYSGSGLTHAFEYAKMIEVCLSALLHMRELRYYYIASHSPDALVEDFDECINKLQEISDNNSQQMRQALAKINKQK